MDKRIDVVATAMHFGGAIDDLAGLDLALRPVRLREDPLHIAAFIAQNQRAGRVQRSLAPGEPVPAGQLVDVRDPEGIRRRHAGRRGQHPSAAAARAIGRVGSLEAGGGLLPGRATWIQRGAILMQSGFGDVYNLAGGYRMWK